jgi:hypothetical protein
MPKPRNGKLHRLKLQIAAEIVGAVGYLGTFRLGISETRLSELKNGKVDRCTIDWLLRLAFQLGGTATLRLEVPEHRPRFDQRGIH